MFYSKADLKNFTKHSLKRNCDEVIFFQLSHNLRFTEKEIHHSYFPMTFPRLFIILFCLKTLVKSCKGLKGTEAFAQIWVEKNWSRKFHKIQPKETVMMPFFHISLKLQLKWNCITVIFRCLLKDISEHCFCQKLRTLVKSQNRL